MTSNFFQNPSKNSPKILQNRMPESVPDEIGYGTSKTRPWDYRFWVVLEAKIDNFGIQNQKKTMPQSMWKFNRFLHRFSTIFGSKNHPKLKPKSLRKKENYRYQKIIEKSSKKHCKMNKNSTSWKSKIKQNAVTVVQKQGSAQPK